ncbi:pilus assembly protein [Candidatus Francisella endociliophora]|uniref:Pilus assembly protein n=2 Tax=Candidatus Francisella endociliophora TaxID=653937 RepID=A0A097ERY0_9GAMM|nr:pilus assembly protein [Francisella sp. FSC1006]
MQAANAIYVAAGATMIDESPELIAEIDVARDLHLSDSTAKWSSNTGVILNLGTTQIVTAVPLDDPPLESGAYLTLAPFTNADVSNSGVFWRCTAFGFDTQLLPSWCVL